MLKSRLAISAGLVVIGAAAQAGTWTTSEATFLSQINGTFYLEDFNSFTAFGDPLNGSQTSWSAPGANGYGWDASAPGGLWSNVGALSTNSNGDPITITFTGLPVSAFGGIIANTDVSGAVIAGTVTLTTNLGATDSRTFGPGESGFLGWVGSSAAETITSVVIQASGGTSNWAQLDHAYTGASAVPEPATMAGLAVGALALLRRRKKA